MSDIDPTFKAKSEIESVIRSLTKALFHAGAGRYDIVQGYLGDAQMELDHAQDRIAELQTEAEEADNR